MAGQPGRARPRTPAALRRNIWIIARHVPGKCPLSIKAFIYLGRTLNILVCNAVMLDVTDSLCAGQDFFFFSSPLTKGRLGKEPYAWPSSETREEHKTLP